MCPPAASVPSLYGVSSSRSYTGNYPQAGARSGVQKGKFAIWNQTIKNHFQHLEMRRTCFVLRSGLPASAPQLAPSADYSDHDAHAE